MKIILRTLAAASLMAFAASSFAQNANANLSPDELVKRVTADVIETIKNDKQLAAGDRDKALALAEEKILPLVDFKEATRLAVGRAWGQASPEQQERLTQAFRQMLVRSYSNAIEAYKGQTLRVFPSRTPPNAEEATVRNQYIRPGGSPISLEYAMRKTPEGWKIYDITVEGISLVLTYRGQTMRVLPVRMSPNATEAVVRNQYLKEGQPPVPVEYAMRKTPEGWKIYDIAVEGVSLVMTYRAEFENVTRTSGIDGLIKRLQQKNA